MEFINRLFGTGNEKIQKECNRLTQENIRLGNEVHSLKQLLEQNCTEKRLRANEYENGLKKKDATISDLSQNLFEVQENFRILQRDCEISKSNLSTNISSLISIMKFCDYALVADSLNKAESIHEILNQLEILLNQNEIYSISEVGGDFDETIHRINEIIKTDDDALDMKVCESLKRGFRKGTQCIEPQEVNITKKS